MQLVTPGGTTNRLQLGAPIPDQYVAGLAVEILANTVQSLEANAAYTARLQQRQIGFGDTDMGGEVL